MASNNNNNTTIPVDMEIEHDPQQKYERDVAEAKEDVAILKRRYEATQETASRLRHDDEREDEYNELLNQAMAKFELLEKFRQTAARRFPLEGFVANNNNNNPNSTITATGASIVHQLSVEDLPVLVFAKEKVDVKCAVVMYNVTSFVTRLEEVMNLHRVDVEREYKRFLPLILGKSYKHFVETKRALLARQGQTETWSLVTQWLYEFNHTPKQKVRNLLALTELTPRDNESGEDYFHRWEATLNDLEVDQSTMAMMTFFFNFNNLPSHWRSKLSMMVKEDAASFIKKTTKEMASFAADLELPPSKFGAQVANSHKRRRTDEPRRRDGTWNQHERGPGPMGTYPSGGIYCRRGCGEKFVRGHICGKPADNQLQPQNNKNSNNNKGHHHQQHSSHYGNRSHHQLDRKVSRADAKYSDAVKRDDAQRKAERDTERDEEYRLAAVFKSKATVGDKLP